MKKLLRFTLFFVLALGVSLLAADNEIVVKVSLNAPDNNLKLQKDLENQAKKEAVSKFIKRQNSNITDELLQKAMNEAENFVEEVSGDDTSWEDIGGGMGQLSGEYTVTLKIEEINQWLARNGFNQQAGLKLTILEEQPSMGSMKLGDSLGAGLDGEHFFQQNYSNLQRAMRDALIKKVDEFGFNVQPLEANKKYEKFKKADGNIFGVYFDVNNNKFVIDKELMDYIKRMEPDTVVLYYQLRSLTFDTATKTVSVTVALNLVHLASGVYKSVSSADYSKMVSATQKDQVMEEFAKVAELAVNKLMNSTGMNSKLNDLCMSIKNAANVPKGPVMLQIDAANFDRKVGSKLCRAIRKTLIENKLSAKEKINIIDSVTLRAEITDANMAPDDLKDVVEKIFSDMGLEDNVYTDESNGQEVIYTFGGK